MERKNKFSIIKNNHTKLQYQQNNLSQCVECISYFTKEIINCLVHDMLKTTTLFHNSFSGNFALCMLLNGLMKTLTS